MNLKAGSQNPAMVISAEERSPTSPAHVPGLSLHSCQMSFSGWTGTHRPKDSLTWSRQLRKGQLPEFEMVAGGQRKKKSMGTLLSFCIGKDLLTCLWLPFISFSEQPHWPRHAKCNLWGCRLKVLGETSSFWATPRNPEQLFSTSKLTNERKRASVSTREQVKRHTKNERSHQWRL